MLSAWLFERIISGWSALLGLALLFGVLIISWHWGTEGAFIYAILLTTTNLLSPWFNRWLDGAAVTHLHTVDMEKYRRAIEQDPANAAAHEYLADALQDMHRYDEAIAEYETVISLGKHARVHDQWKLRRARAAKERQRRCPKEACSKCDALSPSGTEFCPLCGARMRFSVRGYLTRVTSREREGAGYVPQLLRNIAMVLPVVFVLLCPMPSMLKIWLLFLAAIVGGYFLLEADWRRLRRGMRDSGCCQCYAGLW